MEIKDTLLMPKTGFEMRGNLPNKEPKFIERWKEMDLYHKMLEKNEKHQQFILHDGPPYANGNIHLGHALNKILKDFVIRYKSMSGFYTPFVPGWDTHGLPIENALQKQGVNRKAIPLYEFRQKCMEYAYKQVEKQKEDFLRLGSVADYNAPYITLQKEFEAEQIRIFSKMAMSGLIYKGLKPVYWSPSSESALAEAEIEYKDVTSTTIYVAFKVKDTKGVLDGDESFVIWTTTPWTMPADLAICLNPDFEYGVFETSNKGVLIFLREFEENLTKELKLEDVKLRKTFKGHELEYITVTHPMYEDRTSLIILGDHVTNDSGSGCVHTAPGHGADDFIVGMKYGLEAFCPVDEKGRMMASCGSRLEGMFYEEANEEVLKWLEEVNALLMSNKITHSYPHDWRTKKPIIFRATAQWFCSISPIREKILNEIENINWYPSWGKLRMHNMIADRNDWCISRQRAWGVPIPIIYCEDGTPIMDEKVFEHIATLIEKEGSNIWFKLEASELLPEGYSNEHSPNNIFKKETDIMDVWFDSGSSHTSALKPRGISYPTDLYLEGSDQYRGWFNSSLIIGTAVHGKAPYKNVVSHGFIMDDKGQKFSKSLGNGVAPNDVIKVYGVDILRLWVGSVAYQSDVKISMDLIKQVSETYRKIRNTFKFMLGNLNDGSFGKFNPSEDKKELSLLDKFIVEKLHLVVNNYIAAFDNYDFASALNEIMNFITNDLSSFYLDLTKDILYCEEKDSLRRRQVQTVIYETVDTLMRLLSPIIPFTMEEVYDFFKDENGKESVLLLDMPKHYETIDEDLLKEYSHIFKLRGDVLKALEEARGANMLRSSQEAYVEYEVLDEDVNKSLAKLEEIEINRLFIVSTAKKVSGLDAKSYDVAKVKVSVHDGVRCERCWNRYDASLLSDNCICPRCLAAMKKVGY